MVEKITAVMGSLRFWLVTFAMLGVQATSVLEGTWSIETAIPVLSVWAGTVAAIGTIDRFAEEM